MHQQPPPPTTREDVVVVHGLSKRFGDRVVVDDVTFSAARGAVTGFLGPNGAGKTTTLRMLLGLARPTAGEALVLGRPYRDLEHPSRVVGVALENTGAHPGRTGRHHLRVLAPAAGADDRRVDEVLDLVGLTGAARRHAGDYSLGMRQRLALAAALLGRPQVLVLDEPGNGLDPVGIAWLRGFLRDYARAGNTVLFSSHVLGEVEQLVDDVVLLDHGRVVHSGPVGDLGGTPELVAVSSSDTAALGRALDAARLGWRPHPTDPVTVLVDGEPADRLGPLLYEAGVLVTEITPWRVGLEQRFLDLVGPTAAPDPHRPEGRAAHESGRTR